MPYNDFRNNELPQHTNLEIEDRLKRHIEREDILSTVDDGNAVAEQVRLVHEVGGEDDGAAQLVLDQQIPDGSSGVRIHSSSRLIQYNHPVCLI